MRRVVLMALVGGLALCLVPVRAAQAQWVLLARRAIGRVEQMTQSQKGQELRHRHGDSQRAGG